MNRTDGSTRVFDVPAGVHDMLTSFYHFLLVPLSVGDSVEYAVCHNEKNYVTKYPVTGEATIRLPKRFDRSQGQPLDARKRAIIFNSSSMADLDFIVVESLIR